VTAFADLAGPRQFRMPVGLRDKEVEQLMGFGGLVICASGPGSGGSTLAGYAVVEDAARQW